MVVAGTFWRAKLSGDRIIGDCCSCEDEERIVNGSREEALDASIKRDSQGAGRVKLTRAETGDLPHVDTLSWTIETEPNPADVECLEDRINEYNFATTGTLIGQNSPSSLFLEDSGSHPASCSGGSLKRFQPKRHDPNPKSYSPQDSVLTFPTLKTPSGMNFRCRMIDVALPL